MTYDALTGTGTRDAFDERLLLEAATGEPLSLVVFDLHGLGRVNDKHGELAGDFVLRGFAAILAELRTAADVFRLGGDRFALLLPQTGWGRAQATAERAARRISAIRLGHGIIAVAWGIAELRDSPADVRERAERALERARPRAAARLS